MRSTFPIELPPPPAYFQAMPPVYLEKVLRHAERELISRALDRTHWNRKRTARELQISYKALLYKLKQLGLSDQEAE